MTPDELLVLSIALGIVVSFAFSEAFGIAAGGIVVPGYIALHLNRPYALLVTLLVAGLTFAASKIAGNFIILYGRRRTAILILVAFALGAWVSRFEFLPRLLGVQPADASVVGHIIPGLIALWFDRQGVVPTLASMAIGATLVRLALLLLVGPLLLGRLPAPGVVP